MTNTDYRKKSTFDSIVAAEGPRLLSPGYGGSLLLSPRSLTLFLDSFDLRKVQIGQHGAGFKKVVEQFKTPAQVVPEVAHPCMFQVAVQVWAIGRVGASRDDVLGPLRGPEAPQVSVDR
jgi:hypothetical protein